MEPSPESKSDGSKYEEDGLTLTYHGKPVAFVCAFPDMAFMGIPISAGAKWPSKKGSVSISSTAVCLPRVQAEIKELLRQPVKAEEPKKGTAAFDPGK